MGEQVRGGMSSDAAVPLHTAGEPGVPHGKVAGAEHRVVDDEVSPVYLVVKGSHAPAQGGDKGGLEKAVFQHGHVKDLFGLRAVVVVLTGVGQHVEDISVVDVQTLRLIQNAGLFKHFLLVEDGIGAVGPQMGARNMHFFKVRLLMPNPSSISHFDGMPFSADSMMARIAIQVLRESSSVTRTPGRPPCGR